MNLPYVSRTDKLICVLRSLKKRSLRIINFPQPLDLDDVPDLLNTIVKVHGHQLLVDGFFNGDPHPGNVLLTRDGKIGLIDYGQVKRVRREDRMNLCKLTVALAKADAERTVHILTNDIGLRTRDMDPSVLEIRAKMLFDRDDQSVTGGVHIQAFFEEVERRDPITHMPDDYVMAWRLSLLMRGMGWALGQPISTAEKWKDIAQEQLKKEGDDTN